MAETTKTWSKNSKNEYHLKNFYTNIMKNNALLYKYQFVVDFIGLDNISKDVNDVLENQSEAIKNVTYFVQSSKIPGYGLVNGKTVFLGTEFRIPGVLKYDHTWNVNILLNQSMANYKALQAWRRTISRLEIDGGGMKTVPNVQARVSVLSTDHQSITHQFFLEGVWIKSLGELKLDYKNGGGDLLKCDVEFRYQYIYNDMVEKKDPLEASSVLNNPIYN